MDFLLVLVAVVLLEGRGDLSVLQRDQWLQIWHRNLSHIKVLANVAGVNLALLVLLPTLAVYLVLCEFYRLDQPLLAHLLELLVLLYSLGRGNLAEQVAVLRRDLRRDDMQAAFHDAAILNISHRQGIAENWDDFHQELLAALPYRYFERSFAVIFWFFVLGAPGALAYRMVALHGDLSLDKETQPLAAKVLWLLEWLPARLLALTVAIVGNFAYAIAHLHDLLFCGRTPSAELLRRCVVGALGISVESGAGRAAIVGREELPLLQALFNRAITTWLVVIALIVVLA